MAYEYKIAEMNKAELNAQGLAFWQVVGIAKQEPDGKVLLQRDTTLQVVADGLSDPADGMVLCRIVVEPVEPQCFDLRESLKHLRGPVGTYMITPDAIVSQYGRENVVEESFAVRSSGRVEYTRQDGTYEPVIPDLAWADRLRRRVGDIRDVFRNWAYEGQVRSILTISGIMGYTFKTDRHFGDGHTVTVPFIQVSQEMDAACIGTDADSPMLRDLFGKLYWDLGSPANFAFPQQPV